MAQSVELRSLRVDGRLSIEHQLSIHINDLFDISFNFLENSNKPPENTNAEQQQGIGTGGGGGVDLTLMDVLQGLRYVMDYRIRGGKQPSIDQELMRKLAEALLIHMKHKERSILIRQRITPESELAFSLFGDFIEEVAEFRTAVSEMSTIDLMHSLKIHRRLSYDAKQREEAIQLLLKIERYLAGQFGDWRELVKPSYHDQVQELLRNTTLPVNKHMTNTNIQQQQLYPPPSLYFDRRVSRLLDMFKTDPVNGLTAERVLEMRKHYGPNQLPEPPKPSILKMIWLQLTDFMVLILLAAAIAASALGDLKSGVVLLLVILINVMIGFSQDFKASKALEALKSLRVPKATVVRDGNQHIIDSVELVPGDVVVLDEGDAVPADLRLIEVSQLEIVESVLTGESVAVQKSTEEIRTQTRKLPLGDCTGNAFMSTVVARGRGRGVVVRTGERTEIGKISSAISQTPDAQTPVQIQLFWLGIYLVIASLVLCGLIILIGWLRGKDAMEMVKIGVALAVSVIPEGLVAVVTVTLAIGVRRMASREAIVRKLPSVETLGSVSVICSDKTGTLTEGKMQATAFWCLSGEYSITCGSNILDGHVTSIDATSDSHKTDSHKTDSHVTTERSTSNSSPFDYRMGMACCCLCNNSSIKQTEDGDIEVIGDPTEIALLAAAKKSGFDRKYWNDDLNVKRLGEFAFDSTRKLMSTICTTTNDNDSSNNNNNAFVLAKGAPEALLLKCQNYLTADAKSFNDCRPIDESILKLISAKDQKMASSGLRVLGFACRQLTGGVQQASEILKSEDPSEAEQQLTFVGLIGLIDPPRKGVRESVQRCKTAGIRVVMITGDHVATAVAIASQLGIIEMENPKLNRSLRGVDLDLLSEEAFSLLSPFPTVFARVSPDNKLRIVKALQKQGHYVAMTGDGVNDAPAIKAANVGVAMGIAGTEITKQAADIVLANDNFATIVAAVEEGRRVFDNIQKFVVYLLSCNFAEILVMLLAVAVGAAPPFTSIMILLANIIADIPPSMSLGVEPPEIDVMDRPPRNPKTGVITLRTAAIILYQSSVMGLLSLGTYLWTLRLDGYADNMADVEDRRAQTLTYVMLTTMQIFQGFLSRSVVNSVFKTGFLANRYMFYSFFGVFACLMLVIFIKPIGEIFTCVPLTDYLDWIKIFVAVLIQLICSELMKFCLRFHDRRAALNLR